MDAAIFSKTLKTNYEPHGVTSQKTLIFNTVNLEDSLSNLSVAIVLYTTTDSVVLFINYIK